MVKAMNIYELKEQFEDLICALEGKLDLFDNIENFKTIYDLKEQLLTYQIENNKLRSLKNKIFNDIKKYCQLYANENNWIKEDGKMVLKFDGWQQKKYAEMILEKIDKFENQ